MKSITSSGPYGAQKNQTTMNRNGTYEILAGGTTEQVLEDPVGSSIVLYFPFHKEHKTVVLPADATTSGNTITWRRSDGLPVSLRLTPAWPRSGSGTFSLTTYHR